LALGCSLDNIIVSWKNGSKSETIGELSVLIKELVQQNVPSRSFTKNGETSGHRRKEGKKVIVDVVAMQRRRKTIVTSSLEDR
jgi:lysophospholipase L1-like esterase